jgi:hypothetical protein
MALGGQTFKSVDGSGKEAKSTQEELLVWCACQCVTGLGWHTCGTFVRLCTSDYPIDSARAAGLMRAGVCVCVCTHASVRCAPHRCALPRATALRSSRGMYHSGWYAAVCSSAMPLPFGMQSLGGAFRFRYEATRRYGLVAVAPTCAGCITTTRISAGRCVLVSARYRRRSPQPHGTDGGLRCGVRLQVQYDFRAATAGHLKALIALYPLRLRGLAALGHAMLTCHALP